MLYKLIDFLEKYLKSIQNNKYKKYVHNSIDTTSKIVRLNGKKLSVKPTYSENEYKLTLKNNKSGKLIIPINMYKGINIKFNGRAFSKYGLSKYVTFQLNVSKSKESNIVISYSWTMLATVSQLLSIVSCLIFVIFLFWNKFKVKK